MILEIKNLIKEYDNITPLKDVNAIVNKNDVISIIGPSGTGKSTLLRCINGLEDATSGEVIFNGKNIYDKNYSITDVRKKIGMIFQSFYLFNNLTVLENIMVSQIEILHKTKSHAYDTAVSLLDRFSLKDKMNNFPHELSGGQKQRVAIMRAVAMEPEILLFDEPTSALDPMMVNEVANIVNDLHSKDLTMMIVTHEMNFAKKVSNRVFYMDEGIVYEEGTPEEIFEHPKKIKTQEFISKIESFEKEINKIDFDLYYFISEFMVYVAKRKLDIHRVNIVNLLLEEVIVNEIFKNLSSNDNIKCQIQIFNNKLYMKFMNLSNFNFDYKNTDELSSSIINNNFIEKKEDKNKLEISYLFNI